MNRINIKIIMVCFVMGLFLGIAQYWSDISNQSANLGKINLNQTIDQKVLNSTPNLSQILSLKVPKINDEIAVWQNFINDLDSIQLGKYTRATSNTSPLLAFYVYTAKYRPEIFYRQMQKLESEVDLIDNLLRLGLLADWYNQINNANLWLLNSRNAVKSYALQQGYLNAQKAIVEAFKSVKTQSNLSKSININLSNLQFASSIMTSDELRSVYQDLKNGGYNYDPRDIKFLIGLPYITNQQLVELIKNKAYASKSMSSYMATAIGLGDDEYIYTLAKDSATNQNQPTNFYCSICALSLYSDGLIGRPLVEAAQKDNIQISQQNSQTIIQLKLANDSAGAAL